MIKRALKFAIAPSVGVTIGKLIFRLLFPYLYNETWPPIYKQAVLYLLISYIACFLVSLVIEWCKSKSSKE